MTYRNVPTDRWSDPWFEELDPEGKLFDLYLMTNPASTSAGAFRLTIRRMVNDTGIAPEKIEKYLTEWPRRVRWFPEHSVVFLPDFFREQRNSGPKTITSAQRAVAELPAEVQAAVAAVYPDLLPPGSDTPSEGHGRGILEQSRAQQSASAAQRSASALPEPPRASADGRAPDGAPSSAGAQEEPEPEPGAGYDRFRDRHLERRQQKADEALKEAAS